MPTNRNLRSVASALVALVTTVLLLAACPAEDHDLNALGDPYNVPATMAPGPAPEDLGRERAHAMRASRSRVEASEAADRAAAIAELARAKARAEQLAAKAAAVIEAPRPVAPASMDAAFWRRLANCENADGDGDGNGGGYFQFSPDTAAKVGYRPGMSYEQQVALAQKWLAMIGGPSRGGGRSGWPHCWWVALRG